MEKLIYLKENILGVRASDIQKGDVYQIGRNAWRVLEIENHQALMISDKVIDLRPYHMVYEKVSYEESSIHQYINDSFVLHFFPRNFLPLTSQLFLLSIDEANLYFKDDKERKSDHAWWLRDQHSSLSACYVSDQGKIIHHGAEISFKLGLRPAFWMKLDEMVDWEVINQPIEIKSEDVLCVKPYVGMDETNICQTLCGYYYEANLFSNVHIYSWLSRGDERFLQVSCQEGKVVNVLEMYGERCWKEDGSPKQAGVIFQFHK